MNIVAGKPTADGFQLAAHGTVPCEVSGDRNAITAAGIRPEHITVTEQSPHCEGTVELYEYLGADCYLYVNCGELGTLTVRVPDHPTYHPNQTVTLNFNHSRTHFFTADGRVVR